MEEKTSKESLGLQNIHEKDTAFCKFTVFSTTTIQRVRLLIKLQSIPQLEE